MVSFPDQDSGRAALEAGEISQLVVLPADYVANGKVAVYDQDFSILRGGDEASPSRATWPGCSPTC